VEQCACCELEHDVTEDEATAEAHRSQLHFPFVRYCPENEPKMPGFYRELYPTPWEDVPREVWFHDEDCEEYYCRTGDFQYHFCESCEREICQQNPSNGWMWQFREQADLGDVCLRCYESQILEHGQPRSDYEEPGKIKGGMFFGYGNGEPKATGYAEVGGFDFFFARDPDQASAYNLKALELIDSGQQVLTAYERMAIGNLEGYLTLMARSLKTLKTRAA
jgi:hypothetical protein